MEMPMVKIQGRPVDHESRLLFDPAGWAFAHCVISPSIWLVVLIVNSLSAAEARLFFLVIAIFVAQIMFPAPGEFLH